ncbi:MAG: type II toxin-antitoxin system RelE/ParE family toxin [Sporichthyaceae bacterium]
MTLATRFEDEASDELVVAATWYEDQHPGLGDRFLAAVQASLAHIGDWPEAAPLVGVPFDDAAVRSAPVRRYPYRIVYVVSDESIRVVAVAHKRRESLYWRGRVAPSDPDDRRPAQP